MQLHIRRGNRVVDFLVASQTVFTLRIIALVDADERRVLCEAGWWEEDLYQSQRYLDLLARRNEIAAIPLRPRDPDRFWQMNPIEQWMLKQVRLAWNGSQLARSHRIAVAEPFGGLPFGQPTLRSSFTAIPR